MTARRSRRCCKRNLERNAQTQATVLTHSNDPDEIEGLETDTLDLLADLMHLADAHGWDFDDLVRRADGHYRAEKHGGSEHGV